MSSPLYGKKDLDRELKDELFGLGLPPEEYRNPWRRDYARLIHSPSFRRLQGKTQLFPGVESDFFRNRLTHSLEVAQIAKSIAIRINYNYCQDGSKRTNPDTQSEFGLSPDLVEFAGLAHDLGHPPFGHQGEEALDKCMVEFGGFEGNAQTFRILSKIEKKFPVENNGFVDGVDSRVGLNLTMRTLASILKYDQQIPKTKLERKAFARKHQKGNIKPTKGYYDCDSHLVSMVKQSVLNKRKIKKGGFKTVECYIMDIADDIAYSTYDLEDGFKAGFISPLELLYPEPELLSRVCKKVNENLKKEKIARILSEDEIIDLIRSNFLNFDESEQTRHFTARDKGKHFMDFANSQVDHQYRTSEMISFNGSIRTGFTSSIVGLFIRGVELQFDPSCPAMSTARLNDEIRILVEILKTFTYMSQINSPRLKIAEFRGKEIVSKIFRTLSNGAGSALMPNDVQLMYKAAKGAYKKRIVCDYIASMTDKYAIEFYGRITSEDPQTIFKPF